ncbi:MAG: hypothetical protein ABII90_10850, partial [Bacteroidota bacterium]
RSENADVIGGDIVLGFKIKKSKKLIFFINPFIGIGFRYKFREYTTTKTGDTYYGYDSRAPLGNYSYVQQYFVLVLGLKIGISINR